MWKKAKLANAAGSPIDDHRPIVLARHRPLVRPAKSFLGRIRWRRLAKRVLVGVAILAVSYLVIVNVALRTRFLRNALGGSPWSFGVAGPSTALTLDYESAYSILPGRVHLEGVTIRGQERTVEWRLVIDEVDVTITLHDLLRRSFHATRVRANGFEMRARLRLHPAQATPDVVAALPPIEGFADPPLLDPGPVAPPLTDENYNLWMIDLEDVDVQHVRELWIHGLRSEGDTHVRGRWLFRPKRWLDVGPATVEANGVDVSYGKQPLATGLHGSFGATVGPFDLRDVKAATVFENVTYDGDVHGRGFFAGALRLMEPRSGVSFTRWDAPFDARVVVDRGRILDGTRIRTEPADGGIEAGGLDFEATIGTDLAIEGSVATVDARISTLRVSRQSEERARVASIATTVKSRRLDLARLFDDATFTLDVAGAETKDVGAFGSYLPKSSGFVVRSGVVTANAHAEGSLAEKRGRADARIVARRLTVEVGSDQVTADVTSDVRLREVALAGGGSAVGDATITAEDVAARVGPALVAGGFVLRVDLRRAAWDARTFDLSGSDLTLRALSAKSSRSGVSVFGVPLLTAAAPRLVLAPSGAEGRVVIDVPRAELAHLGALHELLPMPEGIAIDDGWALARAHADVDVGTGAMRGEGAIVSRGIRARVGSTVLFGNLDVALRARRDAGSVVTDLSGSNLAVTRAGTGSGAPPEDAWWGKLALPRATLRTVGGVHFDAKVRVSAKDASPATALVAENTAVPKWAANIFRMPVLDATAEVRVAPRSFEVHTLVASGGGNSVRAEYAKRAGRQDGAVLLDLGWIDLGYDLAEGDTGLVILGPDTWFERKTAILRDASIAARRTAEANEQLARYAAMTPALRRDEGRALAARCALDLRTCDGAAIQALLRAAADGRERGALSGVVYAPMVVAAAKGGKDGATLDPRVVGSVAEALRLGGASTLDDIPTWTGPRDSSAARGKVIAVTGRVSEIRREGSSSVGTMTTDAGLVTFVTPFAIATPAVPPISARFRGVYVERYAPADVAQSLVLVGAFVP